MSADPAAVPPDAGPPDAVLPDAVPAAPPGADALAPPADVPALAVAGADEALPDVQADRPSAASRAVSEVAASIAVRETTNMDSI